MNISLKMEEDWEVYGAQNNPSGSFNITINTWEVKTQMTRQDQLRVHARAQDKHKWMVMDQEDK